MTDSIPITTRPHQSITVLYDISIGHHHSRMGLNVPYQISRMIVRGKAAVLWRGTGVQGDARVDTARRNGPVLLSATTCSHQEKVDLGSPSFKSFLRSTLQ